MDVDAYLNRLGLSRPTAPDLAYLERLQRAHLTEVPFENLDVYARRDVRTTEDWSVPKVVDRGRGGWCFELNGAFGWLLAELGYRVRRHAASVLYGHVSPMPTHLTLQVTLDRPFLVDVGFGDSFIRPLPLDSEGPHDGGSGAYGFIFEDDRTTLVSHEDRGVERHYRFTLEDRHLAEFEGASSYLRTTPGLQWTKGRFATRLLDGGPDRVTLLEDVLKIRRNGAWVKQPVTPEEWEARLAEWFGMTP